MNDDVIVDGSVSNSRLDIDTNVDVKSITIQGAYARDIAPDSSETIRIRGNLTLASTSSGSSFTLSPTSTTQVDGNLTISQGTLRGNTADLHVLGNFVQTGGTVNNLAGVNIRVDGSLTEAGGTFTGSTGTIQVGGNLSVTSGTFNGSAGIIKIGGDLGPLSGGTFRASSETTWIGGAFNRTSSNNTFTANNGDTLFNATSSKTHLFSGAVLSRVVFNDGLVGYWNLDENTGTTVNDTSEYVNAGTSSNLTWATASPPPLAFADTSYGTFNGTSSRIAVSVANLPATHAAHTISAWVKITALPSGSNAASLVAMTASGRAVKLGVSSSSLRVLRNDGTALISTTAPSTGAWHHIAYTWNGMTNRLYVDGAAVSPTTTAHDSGAVTSCFIGATSASADFFNGSLDEVRIYDRALSSRDIAAMALGHMPATSIATHTLSDALVATQGRNQGDFVIASGTVTGPGAITPEGDWQNFGGRYTGSGLVTLTGGTNARVILSGGETFASLTVNSGGRYTLSDRLWATGTLTVAQTNSFADGGYVAHVGGFTTTVANAYRLPAGTIVIDGRSSSTITSTATYNNLRIEAPNETGLCGYWKLDEGQGETARDFSGSGNTGTVAATGATGAAAAPAIVFDNAQSMAFDGSAGYVSVGTTNIPATNAAQTISGWIYITSLPGSANSIVSLSGSSSAIRLGLSPTNLRVVRNDGTVLIQTTAPSTNAWHHVAYTWNGIHNNLFVDGTAVTPTITAHDSGAVTGAFIGATSASAGFFAGRIDDVRIYSSALTSLQVSRLAGGTYAGTGSGATVTLGDALTVGNTLAIDAGTLATGTETLSVSLTTSAADIPGGTLSVGSGAVSFLGGLTVRSAGTLSMMTSGGSVRIASGKALTMNGTFAASSTGATIRNNGSGTYAFSVGTTSTSTPALNITGLAVQNTDTNGMRINVDASSVTTFTRFDNIAFSSGTGTRLLQIFGQALYLSSSGCTFDAGVANATTTYAVTLAGNGSTGSPDTTETRAVFGGTTCADNWTVGPSDRSCLVTAKSDDDADGNGIGNTPASNGAVVQFVRAAGTDTAGTIEGLPTAAFDWNDFSYYSTYATFHDVSGTVDRVYVRSQTGAAEYAWDTPSGETIVGQPRWNTIGGSHYLFVALASGKVYRLIDNGSSLAVAPGWSANPYNCSCTITSPLGMDAGNLYWGGTASGNKVWTLGQSSGSTPGLPISITPAITTAAPVTWTNAGTTYLFLGTVGNIVKINATSQMLAETNTNPGSASVFGRISIGTNAANRVLAGDDAGRFWSIDPLSFTATNRQWSYSVSGDSIRSSPYSDYATNTVHFGTQAGKVVVINNATGAARTGYPYTPGTSTDAIQSPLFYRSGILAVGTTTGKLFFIDRNNGTTGPALIRQFAFGPTQSVSGVGYDANVNRYMVSTSDSAAKDGRLYYFDAIADPTGGSL